MRLDPKLRDVRAQQIQGRQLIFHRFSRRGRRQRLPHQERRGLDVPNAVLELTQVLIDELFSLHAAAYLGPGSLIRKLPSSNRSRYAAWQLWHA